LDQDGVAASELKQLDKIMSYTDCVFTPLYDCDVRSSDNIRTTSTTSNASMTDIHDPDSSQITEDHFSLVNTEIQGPHKFFEYPGCYHIDVVVATRTINAFAPDPPINNTLLFRLLMG
jgi:hypothetical protein